MEKLSLEDRLLLRGKYIEGKSAQELAEMLGCKPDFIRMKMRALEGGLFIFCRKGKVCIGGQRDSRQVHGRSPCYANGRIR